MAPNFQCSNTSLAEGPLAELRYASFDGEQCKLASTCSSASAVRQTPISATDADRYWDEIGGDQTLQQANTVERLKNNAEESNCYERESGKHLSQQQGTVEQMENRKAALSRLRARIKDSGKGIGNVNAEEHWHTPISETDADRYWDERGDQTLQQATTTVERLENNAEESNWYERESGKHLSQQQGTVEQMENRKAALSRLRARIKDSGKGIGNVNAEEHLNPIFRRHTMSTPRRRDAHLAACPPNTSDHYWNEKNNDNGDRKSGRVCSNDREEYWNVPSSQLCDGATAAKLAQKVATARYVNDMVRSNKQHMSSMSSYKTTKQATETSRAASGMTRRFAVRHSLHAYDMESSPASTEH
jgi:hypothetical protein